MSKLKAFLFDVDGTLADTERDGHRVAFNMAFADAGLNWNWDEAHYGHLLSVTGGKERMRFHAIENDPVFLDQPNIDTIIARLHKRKNTHYKFLLENGAVNLRSGVVRLIEEAKSEGLRLAIATTTSVENVECLIQSQLGSDALKWFSVIAAGDMVPNKKPAPDVFLLAMRELNLSAEECIAFEDSYNGLLSATAAGLKSIVTVNDYTKDDDLSTAALLIDGLGEPAESIKVLQGEMCEPYVTVQTARSLLEMR